MTNEYFVHFGHNQVHLEGQLEPSFESLELSPEIYLELSLELFLELICELSVEPSWLISTVNNSLNQRSTTIKKNLGLRSAFLRYHA